MGIYHHPRGVCECVCLFKSLYQERTGPTLELSLRDTDAPGLIVGGAAEKAPQIGQQRRRRWRSGATEATGGGGGAGGCGSVPCARTPSSLPPSAGKPPASCPLPSLHHDPLLFPE
ncbi:hypothetical protein PBY51_003596 [Eleginops maclovinus]|uniref:Uncharacterized protein n=1 Tax=Eleginops maclovinus TaxID=56733 RepID=A0AAN7Y143_ELEMC|nr:hypothetical protein PBY51_003596 [Eleginops maclovinus]